MDTGRHIRFLLVALALFIGGGLIFPSDARAEWDAHSTAAAPCGTGLPPPGHEIREIASPDRVQRLALEVKQDGNRLCYVSDGLAEAPVIRLRLGDALAVTLTNEITDSTAIAGFVPENQLDEPHQPVPNRDGFIPIVAGMQHEATGITNLHLHGFAVPPVPPQDEVLRTCADPAMPRVSCGRRTISYLFRVPPTMPAGLYWYHPHVHGEAEAQVEMGLYGAIVVEGPEDDARRAMGIRDRILVVGQTQPPGQAPTVRPATDDSEGDDEGEGGPTMPAPVANARPAKPQLVPSQIDTEHELGCAPTEADGILTLNGTPVAEGEPADATLAHFEMPATKKELWRIVNATADDYLDLALIDDQGAALPITIVALDGAPLTDDRGARLEVSPTTASQLVPPSGRIEFLVSPPAIGHTAHLMSHAVDTGCSGAKNPERTLAVVSADRTAWPPKPDPPPQAAASSPGMFSGILARRSQRERTIALAEYPRPGTDDEVDYYISEMKPGAELQPFRMDGSPAITVRAGTTEEWVIENWTHELHAFHIHQVHFRVLAVNDQPIPDPPLVDVVNVPFATPNDSHAPGAALLPGRVRIKITFPKELAGDILFHCHIMEHEDNGMMAVIRVLPISVWRKSEQHAELSPEQVAANPPICSPGTK